jgi:3-oxoacyl-[acyl-carrier protein] reductase
MRSMMKQRYGRIINITSVVGANGNAGQANYAASKAGTEAFSRSVALEIASRGVRVNCIAPGFIGTEMTEAMTEEAKNKILPKIPLASIGEGVDVANAVRFLLSDDSKYITGQTINVNGGLFMN